MNAIDVGIFQLLPGPEGVCDREVIEQALWEVDFAESRGFDAVWITEHHLSSFGLVGVPSVYAAAVAQRTRRVGIGYAIAVVPLHHPVRLAEEISWVGHLSRGRLLVGLGPGFSPYEFGAFGVPLEERHERLEEGSEVLRGLLETESFSHRGKHWSVPPVTLRPRPFGGAPPVFLRASSGLESFRAAAARGEPVMLGLKPIEEIAQRLALYRSIRSEAGVSPATIESEIARFRVLRRVVVADRDGEAAADARRALAWEAETARRVHEPGRATAAAATLADGSSADEAVEIPGGCVGSPRTVLQDLQELGELGVRHVIAWMNFGDLPYAKVRRSMELFARKVLPKLSETRAPGGGRGKGRRKVEMEVAS